MNFLVAQESAKASLVAKTCVQLNFYLANRFGDFQNTLFQFLHVLLCQFFWSYKYIVVILQITFNMQKKDTVNTL